MFIEGRVKNVIIMCGIWALVPLTAVWHIIISNNDGRFTLLIAIIVFACAFIQIVGVHAYLGNYEILAGFNTISKEQIGRYNIVEVTSFIGIFLTAASIVVFFLTLTAAIYMEVFSALFIMTIAMTCALVLMGLYVEYGKRFRSIAGEK